MPSGPARHCCSTLTARWPTPIRFIWKRSIRCSALAAMCSITGISQGSFRASPPPRSASVFLGRTATPTGGHHRREGSCVPPPGCRANPAVAGPDGAARQADDADVPMVAITNAPLLNAEMLLSGVGITQRFKALVIGDELAHGKPHPMPYLERLRCGRRCAGSVARVRGSRSEGQSASAAGMTIRNWPDWSQRP
jgi:hypothetical protein